MKKPNYKRQKALLALLDTFDGQLSKTDLQKYMFLYVKEFSGEDISQYAKGVDIGSLLDK